VMAARGLARKLPVAGGPPGPPGEAAEEPAEESPGEEEGARSGALVPAAAALVGFAFLLMELVWYRMLGPLLGGSSYTFGLILAVALLGIGLGGLLYGAGEGRRRPTLMSFAATCALESLLMALPLALGDRVAVLAALLRPLASAGFLPLVGAWTAITALVVLPAAVVAGYQFPLLIALLGPGRRRVGREVGVAYAANTLGAILGSIAGGFGLIPLLAGLAAVAAVAGLRAGDPRRAAAVPLAAGAVGLLLCLATGPTAFWRHTPIGAGREPISGWNGPNDIHDRIAQMRRRIVWEVDGVESSVALDLSAEYAFVINGKSDGTAIADAPMQVMSGLTGTLVHPNPRRALVIGLGTGSTAGWLAQVPSIERVDVVELEPAIKHVARVLSPVNLGVLSNPKVHLVIGDGRELLLTGGGPYDVIFSEPSNPYRAGVASLFSADFYRAVRQRLRPGGLFLQWLQGYELDARVVRTVYATLGSVFPSVESWRVNHFDLLLMAGREPLVHDLDLVRSRVDREPYRTALAQTWGVGGAEGFYAAYAASPDFARAVAESEGSAINTDDRSILEFGFARNLGRFGLFHPEDLLALAKARRQDRPATRGAPLDGARLREMRVARSAYWEEAEADLEPEADAGAGLRNAARRAGAQGDGRQACASWLAQPEPPRTHADLLIVGACLADAGDPRAARVAAALAGFKPAESALLLARWHAAAGRRAAAGESLLAAFAAYRSDPWTYRPLVQQTLPLAVRLAREDKALGRRIWQALGQPFAIRMFEQQRLVTRIWVAQALGEPGLCAEAIAPMEPHVPWEEPFLLYRYDCYRSLHHPLAGRAGRDLEAFRADAPPELAAGLAPEGRSTSP
jgi:spermidine synthase